MRRTCLHLLLFAILTGCGLPLPTIEKTPEALFDQALAELSAGDDSSALQRLQNRYPQSEWTLRAQGVALLLAEKNAAGRNSARRLKAAEKELAGCRRDAETARQDLAQARRDLEELKRLVIEMELRARPPRGKNR